MATVSKTNNRSERLIMAQLVLKPFTKGAARVNSKLNTQARAKVKALAKAHGIHENHVISSLVEMALASLGSTKKLENVKK